MMRGRLNQSVGYIEFVASLGAGAIVAWVVTMLAGDQLDYVAANSSNSLVQQSNQWLSILVENLPVVFLLIAAAGGVAWAVFQTSFV